ncbi:MAG: PilZ domain-containing protein [Candidatus Acidiferrum sp.]
MKENGHLREEPPGARSSPRVQSLREITITYEGQDEQIVVKPPNLSKRGMFINTNRSFPEGAVLNLRFTLLQTDAEIRTRCEVRYCQPGVGVGVEFIGLRPEATKLIEREIARSGGTLDRDRPLKRLKKTISQTARKQHHQE